MAGQTFGSLRVLGRSEKHTSRGVVWWRCLCARCGELSDRAGADLRAAARRPNGVTCHCAWGHWNKKHGMTNTRPWRIWSNAKERTQNPKSKDYKNYGARGIDMCAEWADSFDAFWRDMSATYEDHLTLERIDVNKGYCKENCRWATFQEQAVNRRNTLRLENGTPLSVAARDAGVKYVTANKRFHAGRSWT